jgi:hypothetical protein
MDTYVPTKMSSSRHTHPWVNTHTRRLSRKKSGAYRKAKRSTRSEVFFWYLFPEVYFSAWWLASHYFMRAVIKHNVVISFFRKIYLWKKVPEESIRSGAKHFGTDFTSMHFESIEHMWTVFKNGIISLMDTYVPTKRSVKNFCFNIAVTMKEPIFI